MVDHTYTDYSVVKDDLLSCLINDEDNDSDSELSEEEKKTKESRKNGVQGEGIEGKRRGENRVR